MTERPILFKDEMVRAILDGRKTQTRRLVRVPPDAGPVHIDPGGTVFGPGPYLKFERTANDGGPTMHPRIRCPYGYPGDRLWVKEVWQAWRSTSVEYDEHEICNEHLVPWLDYIDDYGHPDIEYRATSESLGPWRSPLLMPRMFCRLLLEVVEVRVQRVQDITDDDARAEGATPYTQPHGSISPDQRVPGPGFDHCRLGDQPHRLPFADLWDSINGKHPVMHYPQLGAPGYGRKRRSGEIDESASWAANPLVWAITFKRLDERARP